MFGNDKNQTQKRVGASKDLGVTILTAGCQFNGKLYCKGATRIGGAIEGQVVAEGLLVIEEEAYIRGEIKAEEIVIHGRVEGTIEAKRRVELCATSRLDADITGPSLIVHEGARFNGRSVMQPAASQTNEKVTNIGKGQQKGNQQNKKNDFKDHKIDPVLDSVAMRVPDVALPET